MAIDRREHVRYEPKSPLPALLLWQDESGTRHVSAQIKDISQGGCALFSIDAPLVGTVAVVRFELAGDAAPVTFQSRVISRNPRDDRLLILSLIHI